MHDIHKIYCNDIGISFFWKQDKPQQFSKIQVVFKDIGFLLTIAELKVFLSHCSTTYQSQCCHSCSNKECRSLLLRTPSDNIDLAVSQHELEHIQELIRSTLFKATLTDWMQNICQN